MRAFLGCLCRTESCASCGFPLKTWWRNIDFFCPSCGRDLKPYIDRCTLSMRLAAIAGAAIMIAGTGQLAYFMSLAFGELLGFHEALSSLHISENTSPVQIARADMVLTSPPLALLDVFSCSIAVLVCVIPLGIVLSWRFIRIIHKEAQAREYAMQSRDKLLKIARWSDLWAAMFTAMFIALPLAAVTILKEKDFVFIPTASQLTAVIGFFSGAFCMLFLAEIFDAAFRTFPDFTKIKLVPNPAGPDAVPGFFIQAKDESDACAS